MRLNLSVNLWALVLTIAGFSGVAFSQESFYYRVVSTQQTRITAVTANGTLTWSNAMPNAWYRVEGKTALTNAWSANLPIREIARTGILTQVQVPLYSTAGEVIVGFHEEVSLEQVNALMESYGLIWRSYFPTMFSYWIRVLTGTPEDYIPQLEASDIVLWAHHRGNPRRRTWSVLPVGSVQHTRNAGDGTATYRVTIRTGY